jgi:FAD binding domain
MTIHARPSGPHLRTLATRLGTAHVITDPGQMAGYLVESRNLYQGAALAVARPGSTEEVAFVVRECAGAGVAIVPQGGNTGLVGGGVPFGGIVLSLARLDRIRELDPVNATMTAEAGCILQTVRAAGRMSCATATPAISCSASRWCWPTAASGGGSRGCARTTAATT